MADALHLGLGDLFAKTRSVELVGVKKYDHGDVVSEYQWATDSIAGLSEIGFSHERLQEASFAWAAAHGATMMRPAKATRFSRNGRPTVTVAESDRETEFAARLVVGSDGKQSMARRWTGGESVADPEHHRFGGVLVSGVQSDDRETDNVGRAGAEPVNWFAAGADHTRIYLQMTSQRLRDIGADRSFAALVAFATAAMPQGALSEVQQAGPIGFFPNSPTWATRTAGNDVALIGDAAGAPDPSQGHGTALLFHDVRTLSELPLAELDWEAAIAAYADRRSRYYDAVLHYDRWECKLSAGQGAEADRLRDGHERAKEQDPSLGGFALIEARGPDRLVADAAARRGYFGDILA